MISQTLKLGILLIAVVALTGCKSTFWSFSNEWDVFEVHERGETDEFGEPVRMAVIWKDAVLSGAGQAATRGFGGRIYFYDAEHKTVKANGELTVYGFDDSKNEVSSAADRKYVFTQDEFQGHFGETDLGLSYSIWVPWDKVGGFRQTVALLPVFKTPEGRVIKANQTIAVLPGLTPPEKTVEKTTLPLRMLGSSPAVLTSRNQGLASTLRATDNRGNYENALIGHQEALGPETMKRQLSSTTIPVPRSLGRRMSAAQAPATQPPATRQVPAAGRYPNGLYGQLHDQNQLDDNTTVSYGPSPLTSLAQQHAMQPQQGQPIGQTVLGGPFAMPQSTAAQGLSTPQANLPVSRFPQQRRAFGTPGSFR